MGFTTWTSDQLEQRLLANQEQQSRLDAENLEILEEIDYRQVATGDGCRSLSEWVAGRMDVSLDKARSLVRTMRRIVDRPDLREALESGVSFDRVEAISKIPDKIGLLEHLDVAGVEKQAALLTRITAEEEQRSAEDQFLVMQPSLDESWWKLWGGLDGLTGTIVDQAISHAADQLPTMPDMPTNSGWRRAMGLAQICISDDPPPAQVTVHVDAKHAVNTNGQTGVVLEAGPRVGRQALEAVLCESILEVTARNEDGIPMAYGRRTRTIPPALRRAILERDGHTCRADGCDSHHRLQIHHKIPWSQGGTTDPENLITLCWFHHQIVIHQQGFTPYHHPEHGRIRFHGVGHHPAHFGGHDPPWLE
jgi:5-methylcytosine-specific restriction endonuclease McrA